MAGIGVGEAIKAGFGMSQYTIEQIKEAIKEVAIELEIKPSVITNMKDIINELADQRALWEEFFSTALTAPELGIEFETTNIIKKLQQAFGEAWQYVEPTFSEMFKNIPIQFESLADFDKFYDQLKGVLQETAKMFGEAGEEIRTYWNELSTELWTVFGKLISNFKVYAPMFAEASKAVFEGVEPEQALKPLETLFGESWRIIQPTFKEIFTHISQLFGDVAKEDLQTAVLEATSVIEALLPSIAGRIHQALAQPGEAETLADAIRASLESIDLSLYLKTILETESKLGKTWTSVKEQWNADISEMLENVSTLQSSLYGGSWEEAGKSLAGWWDKYVKDPWNKSIEFLKKLSGDVIEHVIEAWEKSKTKVAEWWNTIVPKWQEAKQALIEFFANLPEKITEGWDKFKTSIQSWWQENISMQLPIVKEFLNSFVEHLKLAWETLKETVQDWWDVHIVPKWQASRQTIQQLFSPLIENIKNDWDQFKEAIRGWWNDVVDTWNVVFSTLKSVGGEVISNIISAWNNLKEAVGNFWDGVVEKWYAFWDGVKQKINAVKDAIKELFDFLLGKSESMHVPEISIGGGVGGATTAIDTIKQIEEASENLKTGVVENMNNILRYGLNPLLLFWDAAYAGFQWLYNELVGHSIVPDMITAIVDWFNNLVVGVTTPLEDFKQVVTRTTKEISDQAVQDVEVMVNNILTRFSVFDEGLKTSIISGMQELTKSLSDVIWDIITGVSTLTDGLSKIGGVILRILNSIGKAIIEAALGPAINAIAQYVSNIIASAAAAVTAFLQQAYAALVAFFAPMLGPFAPAAAIGVITGAGALLVTTIQGIVGSIMNTTSKIQAMAEGGVVTRPTIAMVGEAGPEAVLPLGNLEDIMYTAVYNALRDSQERETAFTSREIVIQLNDTTLARALLPALERELNRLNASLVRR